MFVERSADSYTIIEPNSTGGAPITVGQETIQYDALGRPLGEFQTYNFPGGAPGLVNTETTQHTFVYDANSGEVVQEVNEINGTDPVRYVYGPNGNVIVKEAGTGGSVTFNQTLYALQGADGSTVAITDGGGNVLERYVFDGLGNAQALQANGTAYTADANPGTSGTPGQQINEYFVGSTFDTSGNQTADGTHYNWTILYQGETYDAMPGVYETASGAFNPRQQSLLSPDLNAIQQGLGTDAYDPGNVDIPGTGGWQSYIPLWGEVRSGIAYWHSGWYGSAVAQFVAATADAFLTAVTLGASSVVKAGLQGGLRAGGEALGENIVSLATRQGLQRAAMFTGGGAAIGDAVGVLQGGIVGYGEEGWNGAWNGALFGAENGAIAGGIYGAGAFAIGVGMPVAEQQPLGGAYGDLDAQGGLFERHHMPANSVSPLSEARGPAILMDPADHAKTMSYGALGTARGYRQMQAALIANGNYFDALQMDINDIRANFDNKYDVHIQQMLE